MENLEVPKEACCLLLRGVDGDVIYLNCYYFILTCLYEGFLKK